jgi:hypothetical protein
MQLEAMTQIREYAPGHARKNCELSDLSEFYNYLKYKQAHDTVRSVTVNPDSLEFSWSHISHTHYNEKLS